MGWRDFHSPGPQILMPSITEQRLAHSVAQIVSNLPRASSDLFRGVAQAHDPAHKHGLHTEPVHLSTHCIEASDDEAWSILLTFLSTSKAVTQNSFQSNLAPHAPSHENIGSLASRYLYINKTPPIHQFTRVIKKKHRRHRKKMCVTRPQESNPRAKCYAIHAMLILSLTLAHIR